MPDTLPLALVSTLGTTEACLVTLRQSLEQKDMEVVTFHTNGSGGDAMEHLIRTEDVAVVVDLSLHELMDHFFGGDYDAGPERGAAALNREIPAILVPGNTDFLVAGPLETATDRFHINDAAFAMDIIDRVKRMAGSKASSAKSVAG